MTIENMIDGFDYSDIVDVINGDYPEIKDSARMSDTVRSRALKARIAFNTIRWRFNRSQDSAWTGPERERWLEAARAAVKEFNHLRSLTRRGH